MTTGVLRIDKWLWFARFFKSRSIATKVCNSGRMRLNDEVVRKTHETIRVGDVLTFSAGDEVRVIKVLDLGERRGPAVEAQKLYEDLDPPSLKPKTSEFSSSPLKRDKGAGRPTKTDRRAIDKLQEQDLDLSE